MPSNPLLRRGVPAPQQPWARSVDALLDGNESSMSLLRNDMTSLLRARLPVGSYIPESLDTTPPSGNVYLPVGNAGNIGPEVRVTTKTGLLRVTVSCVISLSVRNGVTLPVQAAGAMTYTFNGAPLNFDDPSNTTSPEALTGAYYTAALDTAAVEYPSTQSMTRVHQLTPGTYTVGSRYAIRGNAPGVGDIKVSFSQRTLLLEPL